MNKHIVQYCMLHVVLYKANNDFDLLTYESLLILCDRPLLNSY